MEPWVPMREVVMYLIFSIFIFFSKFSSAEQIPKDSIYNLNSIWKNQENKEFKLSSLTGQKVLITMIYSSCPHACPMTIAKVKEIDSAITKASNEKYKIVLASFDAKRDTPEKLKKYMESRLLNPDKWIFLSAPNDSTARELAVILGISYKELEDGEFSHSNVISLLNKSGIIKAKTESLTDDNLILVNAFSKE
jgi:protein SCO1/2